MGKNHRHKKDLKAEKAKVKLKQSKTKFLPKGQNVTNPAFKIKAIVLPEQLKAKDSDDILSKRKLNVKDLLSRLKHYNENVKHSACEELADMVRIHSEEIVRQQFSEVCLTLGSLMQDRDHKVRKAAAKVIDSILQHIPSEKLKPFFYFFSTNLRCAMTNINRNIQEDSLLFLDCFIRVDCDLITDTSEKLLPDFFTLISKLRSDSQLERTLTLNLGSKMTSVAWRIKVLSRLHAVLNILLSREAPSEVKLLDNEFDVLKKSVYPIYKCNFNNVLDVSTFDWTPAAKTTVFNKGGTILNRHIVTLVPLLYETWLEVVPERIQSDNNGQGTVLNDETATLLLCIVNTLYLLWKYIQNLRDGDVSAETVFMSNEGRKFLNHLLAGFPYTQTGSRSKNNFKNSPLKILDYNTDSKCVYQNLLICLLYSVLYVNHSQKDLRKEIVSIVSYITKILFQKNSIGDDSANCLVEFFDECLGKNYARWRRSGVDLRMILDNAVMFYDHGKIGACQKLKLFDVLSGVIDNPHLNRTEKYQHWLSTLPDVLCRAEISDKTISALLGLAKKNCKAFYVAFLRKLPDILANLDNLSINITKESLTNNVETSRREIAYLFYYIPSYSESDMETISRHFCTHPASDFKKYMEQIFSLRVEFNREKDLLDISTPIQ